MSNVASLKIYKARTDLARCVDRVNGYGASYRSEGLLSLAGDMRDALKRLEECLLEQQAEHTTEQLRASLELMGGRK
jgi:hypothetical protein